MKRYATYLLCFAAVMVAGIVVAQTKKGKPSPPASEKVELPGGKLNQVDANNRRQGMWYHEAPALRGEPAYKEFGSYQDGQKTGLWYKLDSEGNLMAIENYRRDVLNGEVQYYSKGRLTCIGHYRGLNPDHKLDSIWVKDPVTLIDSMVVVPSDMGSLRHGTWRYYDGQSGRLTREEEYQVGDIIASKDFDFTSKADSVYIEKRKAMLPHNTNPEGKQPKRRTPRYTY